MRMIIRITEIDRNAKLGKYNAVKVTGTKLDGSTWFRSYFADNAFNNKDLSNFGIGEWVNVVLEQKGKNWNIIGFKEVTEKERAEEAKKLAEKAKGGTSQSYTTSGTSSGWNGRTGEAYDRSASIYLAWEIKKATTTETVLKKYSSEDLAKELFMIANGIFEYIHMGNDQMPKDKDPLSPPV
jgi:hypothetical protein